MHRYQNKVGPCLLDIFKPYRLFSSTPISLPLISLPLISLYLIISRLAGGAEARTAGAGRSAASPPMPLREQAGAAAAVVEREGRTAAGARGCKNPLRTSIDPVRPIDLSVSSCIGSSARPLHRLQDSLAASSSCSWMRILFLVLVCAGSPFDGMPPEGAEAGREPAVGAVRGPAPRSRPWGAARGPPPREPAVGCRRMGSWPPPLPSWEIFSFFSYFSDF